MGNSTLNVLLKDYEQKKYVADLNFEKDKTAFYDSHPELSRLKSKLGQLALDISKAVLKNDIALETKLKDEFDKLKKEKDDLMATLEIPKRSFRAFI